MIFLARNGKAHIENVTQLTPGTDMAGEPSITPDGKMIAYSSDRRQATLIYGYKHCRLAVRYG